MSKVVNIGVIIRNEQGDTFPVALSPQMVSVIQNLLMQIPMMDSKLVDADGKKLASKTSIPIIPRVIEFDWDEAYSPMQREDELDRMKKLTEKYAAMTENELTDGKIGEGSSDPDDKITTLHPERKEGAFNDPDNPFNLELEATGTANKDMTEDEVKQSMAEHDQKLIDKAKYPDPIAQQEGEEQDIMQQDVIVTPDVLPLTGTTKTPKNPE